MKNKKKWIIDSIDMESGICRLIDEEKNVVEVSVDIFDSIPFESDAIEIYRYKDESTTEKVENLMDELFE